MLTRNLTRSQLPSIRDLQRRSATKEFSTVSEEIFVEIRACSITNLLQEHSYNILHTSAASVQSL